jgi:hypothetical protein
MERLFNERDAVATPAAMVERVLTDARRTFGGTTDDELLEQCVRDAVRGLWPDSSKVKTFIPVLALRHVRDMLESGGRLQHPGG